MLMHRYLQTSTDQDLVPSSLSYDCCYEKEIYDLLTLTVYVADFSESTFSVPIEVTVARWKQLVFGMATSILGLSKVSTRILVSKLRIVVG